MPSSDRPPESLDLRVFLSPMQSKHSCSVPRERAPSRTFMNNNKAEEALSFAKIVRIESDMKEATIALRLNKF